MGARRTTANAARPLSAKAQKALLEALRTGCTRDDAARRAEIEPERLQRLLASGEDQRECQSPGAARSLLEAVEREEASVRVSLHAQLRRAGVEDWRASAELLRTMERPTPRRAWLD